MPLPPATNIPPTLHSITNTSNFSNVVTSPYSPYMKVIDYLFYLPHWKVRQTISPVLADIVTASYRAQTPEGERSDFDWRMLLNG